MILLDHGEKPKENTSRIGNMVEFFTFCSENSSALGDIRQRFAQSSSKNYLLESTVCTDVKGKDTALLINTVTSCATKQSRGFNQYRYVLCNQTKQGIKSIPLRLVRPNKAGDQWSLHQSPCNPFSIPFTIPVLNQTVSWLLCFCLPSVVTFIVFFWFICLDPWTVCGKSTFG